MKKSHLALAITSIMMAATVIFSSSSPVSVAAAGDNPVTVYFFYTPGCGQCAEERTFLNNKMEQVTTLSVIEYDFSLTENRAILTDVAAIFEETTVATPFTVVGGLYYVGFNSAVRRSLDKTIDRYIANDYVDIMAKYLSDEPILETDFDRTRDYEYDLPIIGLVDVRNVSLGIVAVLLGFIDGINPCAMWVLIFLISLVLGSKDKKRIWLIGGLFLLTSGIFYFLIMMAWLNTVALLVAKTAFQIVIGSLALIAGGYNIYSFVKAKVKQEEGCEVTNVTMKQKMAAKARQIANATSLPLALVGVVGLAIIVNAVELACSTGLPLVFTQVLALNGITGVGSIGYVLLYILFFLIDDLVVFGIAVFTLKVSPLATKIGRYAHLVGGLIMIVIGFLMIFFPEILLFSFL